MATTYWGPTWWASGWWPAGWWTDYWWEGGMHVATWQEAEQERQRLHKKRVVARIDYRAGSWQIDIHDARTSDERQSDAPCHWTGYMMIENSQIMFPD